MTRPARAIAASASATAKSARPRFIGQAGKLRPPLHSSQPMRTWKVGKNRVDARHKEVLAAAELQGWTGERLEAFG
jgi:hypothetical protein